MTPIVEMIVPNSQATTKPQVEEIVPVSDDDVITMIVDGIHNSVGDWLNSAPLARERQKSTHEYGMIPTGHLSPQGVSQIVSSDTVEVVEGYLAILSELILNHNAIAKFTPHKKTATSLASAKVAADLINHIIFRDNPGWLMLSTWMKSALLWKNSILFWEYIEQQTCSYKEFEKIETPALDLMLAQDDTAELVGQGETTQEIVPDPETGDPISVEVIHDVRIRYMKANPKIVLRNIRPELFRIARDATTIAESSFVAIQEETTRSEIRKNYGHLFPEGIEFDDIGDAGIGNFLIKYSEERAVRKQLAGEEGHLLTRSTSNTFMGDEANTPVFKTHAWLRADRDGDGIAELKKFTVIGDLILEEEDVDEITMACIVPFEIPHEFHGLAAADLARPTTMATTAILRGFVENVYMTNYSPKLADPNVVDFGALQNMKPKQLIATSGNPTNAVAALSPDTISTGTVPLLETLQLQKEQATGLSKAAQGLNDTLYVSGNSEEKLNRVQSATQVRIQYMARRFVEMGFKPFLDSLYKLVKTKMAGKKIFYMDAWGDGGLIDPSTLPDDMYLSPDVDVGEFGNTAMMKKLQIVSKELIPALRQAGAGSVVKPEAAASIANKTLQALNLNPLDFIVDHTTPEFLEKAEQSRKSEEAGLQAEQAMKKELGELDIAQRKGTVILTNIQSKNAIQDNARQLAIAMDASQQKWADIIIKAGKEGIPEIAKPIPFEELLKKAMEFIQASSGAPLPDMADSPTMGEQKPPAGMMNGGMQPAQTA
jgi:hypothetical protein